ncbi:MAG: helix-turn-helix transcriptional regulator [Candidatus Bathyarchaeota archaeon]|nr:helix-turn-helix transcriptional regulator [Candidatus Bathyarchaeota archaeon]
MAGEDACGELRRRLARGFLDLLILRLLMREPLWGYRMMSMLRKDHGIRVGPPVVYPLLNSMEADGLVESEDVYEGRRRRRVFRATRRGLELVRCFEAVLSEMLGDSGSPRRPPAASRPR